MKLTKFVHSCVMVEDDSEAFLVDPGIFSWNAGVINVAELPNIKTVVITHSHADHMGEPFVKALVAKFPDALFIAPPDAHSDLKSWGVTNVTEQSNTEFKVTVGDHAPVAPFGVQVQNLVVHWKNKVTITGDTHDVSETKDVLLLPIQAPWGTTVRAIELVEELKPKYVLPVHDWMWNEQWREGSYDRLQTIFDQAGVTFLRPIDGKVIEI